MATDEERFILEMKKAKLELEHQDILDLRNTLLVGKYTIPFAVLALPSQLNLVGNNLVLLIVAILSALMYDIFDNKTIEYNAKVREKRGQIDVLIASVLKGNAQQSSFS